MWSRLLPLCTVLLLCYGKRTTATTTVDWWESATLYQIYPRSFMDSNGDGVGDLNGIASRLEYLKELGVTATWLSPIFKSPMADFGYDISNFTEVDPIFGTMADFDALITKAHQLGLKIILDFVPNHSSDECEWFQKSVRREDGYDDFYVWEDGKIDAQTGERMPPSNWVSVFSGSMWTWNEQRQQYFLHQFLPKQPDLNFRNQMVREHMRGVLKFWSDRGVDGFRIDAVPHIGEKRYANGTYPDEPSSGWSDDPSSYNYHEHIYTKDQPLTLEVVYEWRQFFDEYKRQNGVDTIALLAEAYSSVEVLSDYINNGTHSGTQIPMNFNLMSLIGYSTAKNVEDLVKGWMDTIWPRHQTANWVLGNHDSARLANRVGREKVDLMTMLVHALPGTSVTYYGEEIGMSNVATEYTPVSCDDRDPERTPMQWDTTAHAGFTTGSTTWLPVSVDYEQLNVATERSVARSHLNIFKGMTKLKQTLAFKAFKDENGFSFGAVLPQVFQVVRTAAKQEEYRILINMGNKIEYLYGLANQTMVYVLLSQFSPHSYGEKVDLSKRLYMMPYEAVVLRWSTDGD
ncbi:PREDICTED: maltase A2 [Rhagoletis zephyria]|uniref:maltase A2 n=1 Tax=Rhagoletis zephyria TaxID=28612 RepID=UPI00081142F5|nr:PREDICTED: maltase A2 [Rhagoletis zephyria]